MAKKSIIVAQTIRLEALELLVAFGVDRGEAFDVSPGDARVLLREGRAKRAAPAGDAK